MKRLLKIWQDDEDKSFKLNEDGSVSIEVSPENDIDHIIGIGIEEKGLDNLLDSTLAFVGEEGKLRFLGYWPEEEAEEYIDPLTGNREFLIPGKKETRLKEARGWVKAEDFKDQVEGA